MGYRFKTGTFADKTMEHAFLRYAPELYRMARWAKLEKKPHLVALVMEFERLRSKLRNAPIVAHCAKPRCKRPVTDMTLPLDYDRYFLPQPFFWCKKHGPWVDEGISEKLPIRFDVINSFEEKKNRVAVHRAVLMGLGINRRSQITEKYAREYFDHLHHLDWLSVIKQASPKL